MATTEERAQPGVAISGERFRHLVEEIHDWVWEVDEAAVYTYSSPRVLDLLGYTPEEVLGHTPFDFMAPEEAARVRALFQQVAARREPLSALENTMLAKDGHQVVVETSGRPFFDEAGNFRGYCGVDRDITERKRVEQALRESEERYHTLFEAALDAVFLEDMQGTILDANERATEIYGYSREELIGAPLEQIATPEVGRRKAEIIRTLRRAQRMTTEGADRRKNGEEFPTEVSLRLVTMAGQERVIVYVRDITERKRAEQALRESEQRLRAVIDYSPLAMTCLDLDGNVRMWNPAAERLLQYTEEELLGHPLPYGSAEQRAALEDMIRRARAGEIVTNEELIGYRKDGSTVDLLISGTLVRNAAGQPTGVIGMAQDITERKRAEEALRESEQRFRALFQAAPLAVVYFAPDTTIRMWNRAAERIFGWREAEVIGHSMPYANPEEEAAFAQVIARVLAGEEVTGYELTSYRKDQSPVEISVSASLMHDSEGRLIGIIGMAEDITARKEAQEALVRERAFLSSAVDIISFPMGFIERSGQITRVNRAAQEQLRSHNLQNWRQARLLRADNRIPIPQDQWPLMRALQGEVLPPVEMILVFPDEHELPVLLTVAPIFTDSQVVAAVWAFQDITALKQADREKDEFLAFLSHELLTPLTNIMGWAQAARQAPGMADQALEVIERNARRQKQIVDDLLDVSRIVHGKLEIEPQPVDLWLLARESLEDFAPSVRQKGLSLITTPPPEPLLVNADSRRIRQAIGNLLSNAVKFTDSGGTITVSALREGDMAVLSVQDTGRGIAPEALPGLFTPFRQVERRPEEGGLGLGLALVRGIIERHGGQVLVHSPGLGQGTTFTIRLPLAQGPAPQGRGYR